jgi:tRNA A22 N-methylase
MNHLALSERDRAYLRDYIKFGLMNHVVAAEALRSTYEHAQDAATATRQLLERVDEATAANLAARLNDGARVQTIVVAG